MNTGISVVGKFSILYSNDKIVNIIMTDILKNKIYKQTTLNYYLKVKGNVGRFAESTLRKYRKRRSLNLPKMNDNESDIFTNCSDVTLSFIGELKLKKLKLPIPICSDEEDENNNNNDKSFSEVKEHATTSTPKVKRKRKSRRISEPIASTSAMNPSDSSDSDDYNTTTKTKIKILDNTLIKSPKISPNKNGNVTIKEKKLSYHEVNVMQELLKTVENNNNIKHLLTIDDKKNLTEFLSMDRKYQFLIMKLFTYQPIWYNIFKFSGRIGLPLSTDEISVLYRKLREKSFVRTLNTDDADDNLLTLLENMDLLDLKNVSKKMNLSNRPLKNKETIIKQLMDISTKQSTLSGKKMVDVIKDHVKKEMGYCVQLTDKIRHFLYKMFLLNTFTNPKFYQPRDYFNSVGYLNVKFPEFDFNDYQIFYTELEFRNYMNAIRCELDMEKAVVKKDSAFLHRLCTDAFNFVKSSTGSVDESRPPYLRYLSAYYKYISIISKYCDKLIAQYYNDVLEWLKYFLTLEINHHKRAFWYIKLSLIYTKYLKQYEFAAELIIKAFQQDKQKFTDVELYELAKRGKILHTKTYKVPQLFLDQIIDLSPLSCDREWPCRMIERRTMRTNESGRKRKYVENDGNGGKQYSDVEQVAIEHYLGEGYTDAVHFENKLMCALFNLFFWDIIYDNSVIGVLISKVQMWPLDFYTPYFYLNRKELIEQRLKQISTEWTQVEYIKFVETKFNRHSHETSICKIDAFINNNDILNEILSCIDRQLLMKIFQRMVTNFKVYSSGFPDLFVWSLSDKRCKFVEVKGENDKLSIKQKLWLNYLIDSGAEVEICKVHSTGSKKKKMTG